MAQVRAKTLPKSSLLLARRPVFPCLVSYNAPSLNIFVLMYWGRDARRKGQQSFHKLCICVLAQCRQIQFYIVNEQHEIVNAKACLLTNQCFIFIQSKAEP